MSAKPIPGSEIVGPAELRKRKHENKTGGNFFFPAPPTLRVLFPFASSPLTESVEQASEPGGGGEGGT